MRIVGDRSLLDNKPVVPFNSISTEVYSTLKRAILTGEMQPGTRLRVLDIAGKYQISQAPVREALERLKQEGLIVGQHNKGSVVSNITSKEIRDIFVLREMIEGYAVRQSMTQLTEADYDALDDILHQMDEAVKEQDILKILEKDMDFHGFFYRMCGNQVIMELWQQMRTKVMRFMAISNRHYTTEELVDWHRLLIEALRSGDADEAERRFIEHMHSYKSIHLD